MSNNVLFRNHYQNQILILPSIQHQTLTLFFSESNSESDESESESDFNSCLIDVYESRYLYLFHPILTLF